MTDGGPAGDPSPAERYRALWTDEGGPEFVRAFLAEVGPLAVVELADVLQVDQQERWRRGEDVLAEWYLDQNPRMAEDAECALQIIYGEVLARLARGEQPSPAGFARRFPQYAELLALQWEVHRAIEGAAPGSTISPASPRGDLAVGPVVPGYDIEAEVGRGAVGVVYRARQLPLNRLVALKVVLEGQLARPEKLVRFLEEARSLARLRHPSVVGIHDFGSLQSGPYMAMEWVAGGTLAERLAKGRFPPREAARLLAVVARAVGYAHAQNVVHRDLKPANILLTEAGEPKVADFGLAKHLDLGGGATLTGVPLGTALYMSPEQAAGRNRTLGPTTDVYALGAMFYEMLTGRPPLMGATVHETLRLVADKEPDSPRQHAPGVPADLATICRKCLEKPPHRRYATAAELADDLDRFAQGRPVLARPVGWPERSWRWTKRNPAVALAWLLALLFVLAASLAVEFYARWQAALH